MVEAAADSEQPVVAAEAHSEAAAAFPAVDFQVPACGALPVVAFPAVHFRAPDFRVPACGPRAIPAAAFLAGHLIEVRWPARHHDPSNRRDLRPGILPNRLAPEAALSAIDS
jgi:hypothetical protein